MGEVDGSGSSGLLFEWDDQKAAINHAKHGVSFDEASSVLMDPLALFANDLDHSTYEDRYLIIGRSDRGNLLVVSFTERDYRKGQLVIRIISARRATSREETDFEGGTYS